MLLKCGIHQLMLKTVIDGEGYFNDVSDLLKVGDLIYVHASTGGTRTYSLHPVVKHKWCC